MFYFNTVEYELTNKLIRSIQSNCKKNLTRRIWPKKKRSNGLVYRSPLYHHCTMLLLFRFSFLSFQLGWTFFLVLNPGAIDANRLLIAMQPGGSSHATRQRKIGCYGSLVARADKISVVLYGGKRIRIANLDSSIALGLSVSLRWKLVQRV